MNPSALWLILSVLPCCIFQAAFGQHTFERSYGGEQRESGIQVLQTADDGFLILGMSRDQSTGDTDALLIRTDRFGDTLWSRNYGTENLEHGVALVPGSDGGYVLLLSTDAFGRGADLQLMKIDEQGDPLWTRVFGGGAPDHPVALVADSDAGYTILSQTFSYGAGSRDFYLVKVKQNGDSLWARTYGSTGNDRADCMEHTTEGGYVLAGDTRSFGDEDGDVYVVRIDAAGDTLWTGTYGGSGSDVGYSVRQTSDNGFVVTGATYGQGAASVNALVLRLDADGDVEWTRVLGENNTCSLSDVQVLPGDALVAVGEIEMAGTGNSDAFLLQLDSSGDTLWSRHYGGIADDYGLSVIPTSDGGLIFVGATSSFKLEQPSDVYLVKTTISGTLSAITNPLIPSVPPTARLLSNHPNPFNPMTAIHFELPRQMTVSLVVTDALGREIARLADQVEMQAGLHTMQFSAADLPPGVYLYRLETNGAVLVRKMMTMK